MSLNHLKTIEQGIQDKLHIGCETFECKNQANFDGQNTYDGLAIFNSRLEASKLYSTTKSSYFTVSNISTYSTTGNYTLTPEQVVNGIVCVHTQPSNFILPSSDSIATHIQSLGAFLITAGFSFHFRVSVLGTSLGVQIDTVDGGLFSNKQITATVGTLATTRNTIPTDFIAVYDGTVFNYY